MTKKRNGKTARRILVTLALEHYDRSEELGWLIDRSHGCLQAFLEGRDGLVEEPKDAPPRLLSVAGARFKGEAWVLTDSDFPSRNTWAGGVEAELFCLLETLQRLVKNHLDSAGACLSQAERRPGKPRRNALSRLVGPRKMPLPRPPGRPLKVPMSDAALLSALDGRDPADVRSERAILEEVIRRYLAEKSMHAAGTRVPSMVQNLQKRVANARADVRKLASKLSN